MKLPSALPHKAITKLHRWSALLVGVQIILWILSGIIMTWFHIDVVRGDKHAAIAGPVELAAHNLIAPGGIIAQSEGALTLELKNFDGSPVYITHGNGADHMYNALTGEKLSPLDKNTITTIANRDYIGDSKVKHARLLTKTPKEYRGPLPVWQVEFSNNLKTRLYISPVSGEVLSRRNKIWRLYDFMWMLHIMDYDERENHNNLLIKFFSMTSLFFVFSGIFLIWRSFKTGKYKADLKNIRS